MDVFFLSGMPALGMQTQQPNVSPHQGYWKKVLVQSVEKTNKKNTLHAARKLQQWKTGDPCQPELIGNLFFSKNCIQWVTNSLRGVKTKREERKLVTRDFEIEHPLTYLRF